MKVIILAAAALAISTPAIAQLTPDSDPAPGSASLISGNYAGAEREIRATGQFDAAGAINLGIALAKQGDRKQAAQLFNQVLAADDVEMVVASGNNVMSHDLARHALASLESGVLSR